jgi:protein-disulfide isomerase
VSKGTPTRQERRRAELEQRRAQRRTRQSGQPRSLLVPLSIAGVAIGVVAVIVFIMFFAPPAGADLREPTVSTPVGLADGQALGAADAPVTLEVYSDFQCPACGVLARSLEPLLISEYVTPGDVRLVYRDFAFLGQESIDAAVGARCAARENRFWQYHDYLFANQSGENRGAFSAGQLSAIAATIGLDMEAYGACVADPAERQAVLDARTAAGSVPINSTPTLVIVDGQTFVGVPDYSELRAALDAALAAAGE